MQIRELVLYGYNGKVRHLPFALGQVNIITGRSKSGKSVVGDIIDYCLKLYSIIFEFIGIYLNLISKHWIITKINVIH